MLNFLKDEFEIVLFLIALGVVGTKAFLFHDVLTLSASMVMLILLANMKETFRDLEFKYLQTILKLTSEIRENKKEAAENTCSKACACSQKQKGV